MEIKHHHELEGGLKVYSALAQWLTPDKMINTVTMSVLAQTMEEAQRKASRNIQLTNLMPSKYLRDLNG